MKIGCFYDDSFQFLLIIKKNVTRNNTASSSVGPAYAHPWVGFFLSKVKESKSFVAGPSSRRLSNTFKKTYIKSTRNTKPPEICKNHQKAPIGRSWDISNDLPCLSS